MRPSTRLFATVKSAARYLEANTPTGLTGLPTHPSPRPALIYTYRRTLDKLAQMPQSSVYRQSVEALTKHRLAIVESTIPEGHEAWLQRVKKQIADSPDAYKQLQNPDGTLAHEALYKEVVDVWDGQYKRGQGKQEGSNTKADAEAKGRAIQEEVTSEDKAAVEGVLPGVRDLEVEPPLDSEQINAMEQKIGAGLIEEVIQVAEGELLLTEELLEAKPWEELEEKIPPGQWNYFDRGERV